MITRMKKKTGWKQAQNARWGHTNDWPEGQRLCRKCEELKPFSDFHKSKNCKFGFNSVCKPCRIPASLRNYQNQGPEYRLWYGAKGRALRDGREFSIKIADIVVPELCPILGVPLKHRTRNAPSIDRIDNDKGYTVDNIQVISKRANAMKYDATFEEIEKLYLFMKNSRA